MARRRPGLGDDEICEVITTLVIFVVRDVIPGVFGFIKNTMIDMFEERCFLSVRMLLLHSLHPSWLHDFREEGLFSTGSSAT